ncbi:MAG: GntR family transcriptional regulator [Rhizobacter sp.]|nr:GntR family transcriptional regulator [Ferruginibacter sp.]
MLKEKKYKELYRILRTRIIKGEFIAGSILPSESELRQAYEVTQPTIRHALNLLVEERLIKKHQGKGSIVQPRPLGIGIISFEGHSVTSQNDDINIQTKIITPPSIGPWPRNLGFTPNDIELQAEAIGLGRLRTLNAETVFFEKLLIPNIQMDEFCRLNLDNISLYDTLNSKYNISIKNSEQKIWAIAADRQVAKLLQIKTGSPIVRLERRLETNRTDFNIYSSLWANTENYMLYNIS